MFCVFTDINECSEGSSNCSPSATCVDTDGSYMCTECTDSGEHACKHPTGIYIGTDLYKPI